MSRQRIVDLIDPLVVGLGLVLFGLDQLTKYLVVREIGPGATHHSIEVLGNYLRLAYTTNTGAVFGTFSGRVGILAVVSLIAVPVILFSRAYFPSSGLFVRICLGLLFGGNLGNLADRWLRGYVVDFVDMGIGDLRWFTYNIADSSFVVGVIALVFAMLFLLDEEPEKAGVEEEPGKVRTDEESEKAAAADQPGKARIDEGPVRASLDDAPARASSEGGSGELTRPS